MSKLDTIIAEVNGDLADCLMPVATRFRRAMGLIFDYCVANPSQGSAATAQSAIASSFKATYADGIVAPGITIEQAVTAFNNRHGVGANANAKWVSVRDFIVARKDFTPKVLRTYEEGSLKNIAELWYMKIAGDRAYYAGGDYQPVADLVYTETRESTTGPTFNFITERRWSSASLGKAVRKVTTNTFDGTKVNPVEGPMEIV